MTPAQIVKVGLLLVVLAAVLRHFWKRRREHDERLKRARFYKGDLT